ncbi:hypothetical protein BDR26DRAFT_934644 [Obelidium mucronatum]|nr:hypothetical protein BDR26DRAFT_934644 [Obelidium mucronatum]
MEKSWEFEAHTTDENLKCVICSEPFTCPRRLADCGHYYCASCISRWIQDNPNPACPSCRVPISSRSNPITAPDRLIVSMLDDLVYHCDFGQCTFLGSDRDSVKRHQVVCRYGGGQEGGSSSSSGYAKPRESDMAMEEGPWFTKPDNVIAAGVVVAASLIGGLILGRNIGKRERD